MGDNLLKKSDNMGWWKGADVAVGKETIHVDTLMIALTRCAAGLVRFCGIELDFGYL